MNQSFIEKYWKVLAGGFAVIVVAGVAYGVGENMTKKKESVAQEALFPVEKSYFETKSKAVSEKKPADYTAAKAGFEKVMSQFPQSKASQMAAIYLADIQSNEGKGEDALNTLKKVEPNGKGLIGGLVLNQMGRTLADMDKCTEAVQAWDKVVQSNDVQFLHGEARLQQALCYKKLNDTKRAEDILNGLASQKPDMSMEETAIAKEAEKYLRLIRFAKLSGS